MRSCEDCIRNCPYHDDHYVCDSYRDYEMNAEDILEPIGTEILIYLIIHIIYLSNVTYDRIDDLLKII